MSVSRHLRQDLILIVLRTYLWTIPYRWQKSLNGILVQINAFNNSLLLERFCKAVVYQRKQPMKNQYMGKIFARPTIFANSYDKIITEYFRNVVTVTTLTTKQNTLSATCMAYLKPEDGSICISETLANYQITCYHIKPHFKWDT
jgi:hypothetical protein